MREDMDLSMSKISYSNDITYRKPKMCCVAKLLHVAAVVVARLTERRDRVKPRIGTPRPRKRGRKLRDLGLNPG
jgi:hypothetical protein